MHASYGIPGFEVLHWSSYDDVLKILPHVVSEKEFKPAEPTIYTMEPHKDYTLQAVAKDFVKKGD
jgi:hypothetical protein